MPSTTQTIDWEIISSMGIAAAKDIRDALHLESGFMEAQNDVHGEGKPEWGPLYRYQVSLNFYNHTGISALPTGYEPFDPTSITPNRSAFYNPALCGLMMKIGVAEHMQIGQDATAMGQLVKFRTISCMGYLKRQYTRQIVAGGGAGFSNWGTLNGIDYTGASGGVLERSAVGSQSNTIGGLSKSTYGYAVGWNNVVQDLANAAGSNIWRLNLAINQTEIYKKAQKTQRWIMSTTFRSLLARSATSQVIFMNGQDLDQGRNTATYGGRKIYTEPQMPVSTATGGSSTNTYPMSAILLDTEEIMVLWQKSPTPPAGSADGVRLPNGYFGVGRWYNLGGTQMVMGCPILVAGNLVTKSMGSSAVVIRGETY